jgi:hypothetical protein
MGRCTTNCVSREPGADGAMASLRNRCSSIELASYAKPACDVVTETRPCRFHRRLPSSTASELSKPATLLNPGVWEFCNLRSLLVDLFRFLCHHPGFECNRRSRFFDACNLSSPAGWRLFASTLITVRTAAADRCGCSVCVSTHPVRIVVDAKVARKAFRVIFRLSRFCPRRDSLAL